MAHITGTANFNIPASAIALIRPKPEPKPEPKLEPNPEPKQGQSRGS